MERLVAAQSVIVKDGALGVPLGGPRNDRSTTKRATKRAVEGSRGPHVVYKWSTSGLRVVYKSTAKCVPTITVLYDVINLERYRVVS